MEDNREKLKIVVVGHVDHGKSTVIGRILYDTHSIAEGRIDRVKLNCKEKGKPFEYAYLLDAFEEEQKQGITIDTTQLQFRTDKRDYVIIDAPGHKEFLKNMISGAANAEAAFLIIDAKEGVQEQSKRHGYILSLLGIQKVYVIINKMDLIDYSETKFNDIVDQMRHFLNNLGVYPLDFIPISAFFGENLTSPSEKLSWHKGSNVLASMDLIEKDKGLEDKPLRFPIQDVYKFDDRRIIVGRIESGTLKIGDLITITPSKRVTRVKSIEYFSPLDKADQVQAGQSVGITVDDEFFNKRGEFISHKEQLPHIGDRFLANIFWMGKDFLVPGKKYKLKISTQEVECEILKISKAIDASTLSTVENAKELKTNDVGEVIIRTKETISFDEFRHNPSTGRFVLVDGYNVSGGGIIVRAGSIEQSETLLTDGMEQIEVSLFDDYYYVLAEKNLRRIPNEIKTFTLGSVLPMKGATYEYPRNINILDSKKGKVIIIRENLLVAIQGLERFQLDKIPLINTQGFKLNIGSEETYKRYLKAVNELSEGKITVEHYHNQWLDFGTYRQIKFRSDLLENNADFVI